MDDKNQTLHQKLAIIQNLVKVPKSHYNEFSKFYYRTADDIYNAVKPLTQQFDCVLTLSDEPVQIGTRIYIKATASLTDGKETLCNAGYAREADSQKGMNEAQLTGSASSFARKYALDGLLLLDNSRDMDAIDHSNNSPPAAPPSAPLSAINAILDMVHQQDSKAIQREWKGSIAQYWDDLDECTRTSLYQLATGNTST